MTAAEWLLFATIVLSAAIVAIAWRKWDEDDWREQNLSGQKGGAAKTDNK